MGEAWQLLQSGSAARHSAETAMNDRSSRSHCVLCVRVRGQSRLTGEAGPCNASSCQWHFQPAVSLSDDCMTLESSAALSLLAHTAGSAWGQPSLIMLAQLDNPAAPHAAPLPQREAPGAQCPTDCLQGACGAPSCSLMCAAPTGDLWHPDTTGGTTASSSGPAAAIPGRPVHVKQSNASLPCVQGTCGAPSCAWSTWQAASA